MNENVPRATNAQSPLPPEDRFKAVKSSISETTEAAATGHSEKARRYL